MIRQATVQDIPEMLRIYDAARAAMRAAGNPTQWSGGYPTEELLRADIARGVSYVLHDLDAAPHAVFVLIAGDDPTYAHIENGAGRDDTTARTAAHSAPYWTLHAHSTAICVPIHTRTIIPCSICCARPDSSSAARSMSRTARRVSPMNG